ncbi:MAG: metallophosphoesterase [Elusimicrobia bacterium]|nr:metallophosphoesterase [Elusimicrobiota bacterium]
MAKIFFTSDTHFNHTNIIKYCGRPFESVEEMNREMIGQWNAAVGQDDTVFHLGDFALGEASEWPKIFQQLNGAKKILIRGNHDRAVKKMIEVGFAEVHSELEWNGWLLKHKPFKTPKKLLCGHIHERWRRLGWAINVGVDVWDFTPRTIEELVQAEQSSSEYKCRHCGVLLGWLEDNNAHYGGRCVGKSE